MLLLVLAAGAAPLAAQVPRAPHAAQSPPAAEGGQLSAPAEIDRLAARAALLLHRHVPDRAGATIWLLPFLTDTGVPTRLGHRLQSAVHLLLLRHYRSAEIRVVQRRPIADVAPATGALPAGAAAAAHALELEMQPFRDILRVVLRVRGSGMVNDGESIDLPVNEELWELLDGAQAGVARSGDAASTAAGVEPEASRTPLPSAIAVGQGQHRYTTAGEDWVALQVPAPGFYLLEGRSFAGPLEVSLHYDRGGAPVVAAREDAPSPAGGDPEGLPRGVDRTLGIFSGPRSSYARVSTTTGDEVAYYLRLRPLHAERRFADGTAHEVPLDRGTGFQTLRVFRSGFYRVVVEAGAGAAELRVFGVPHMRSVAPASGAQPAERGSTGTAGQRYELAAGDYLVEVTSAPAARAARLCWAASDSSAGCAG
ncbi:MAG: hypothetical protein OXH96_24155 [Spirochaetaceae bacterium]|nr:hypothetical protein [Spirochaetaceae bacterium]